MKWRFAMITLGLALLMGGLAVACGDDGDEGGTTPAEESMDQSNNGAVDEGADTGDEMDDSASNEGDGAGDEMDSGPSDGGSGTLTIGDESWTFDDIFCAFSPEESHNDRVSFTATAFGESASGVRIQFDASIQDTEEQGRYEGDGVIQTISVNDVEDFENPSLGWSSMTGLIGPSDSIIQVDGKNVTGEAVFDDELTDGVIEEVPGTLEATCP